MTGAGHMVKRTIEISQQPMYLAVRNRQLLLFPRSSSRQDDAAPDEPDAQPARPVAAIPCEDVGMLLVDQPAVIYSHAALLTLLEQDAAVVLCGRNHLPAGILLPVGEHSQVVWRLNAQLSASKPLRKRLWQQLVKAKIRAQAANLEGGTTSRSKLLAMARSVQSGDPRNLEAQAARVYWAAWSQSLSYDTAAQSDPRFRFARDPDGPFPNSLLNYGYAVIRAALARAIVAAGLLPALGLRHSNRSNAFCLADDLIEPLRGIVDGRVRDLVRSGSSELTPTEKKGLLELLTIEVRTDGQSGPLMVAIHRYVASLVRSYEGTANRLSIPVLCPHSNDSPVPDLDD